MAKSDPLRQKLVDRYNAALRRMEKDPHDRQASRDATMMRQMLRRHDRAKKGGGDA